jgi:folate/biopterin transporter
MPALKDLKAMLSPIPFINSLCEAFTGRFVIYISLVYFAIKGFAMRSITAIQLPFYQTFLKVSGDDYQKYYNVSMMAFSVKPLIGTLSDNVPIFGFHKRYYLTLLSAMGAAALGCSVLLQPDSSGSGPAAAGMFFVVVLSVAAMDLLCEGKYSELMEKHKETGSSIISWIWAMYMLGGIIASGVEGPLADDGDPRVVLLITAPFFVLPIVPSLLGWVPEEQKISSAVSPSLDMHVSSHDAVITSSSSTFPVVAWIATSRCFNTERKRIIALSIFASLAAIGLALVSLYGTNMHLIYYIIPAVATLFSASFLVLPTIIAKANIFMFCKELVYIQLNGPIDYFYTDKNQCIAESPRFSFTFYQTAGNIVTNVGGMIGVYLFQKYLSRGRFRTVFWITTFIKVGSSFFDVLIILRWNKEYLNIDDHVLFMCGDMVIRELATMLDFMPASVLISRLCPRGMESTMFALLAGMSNFGQNLSRSIGVVMAEQMNVRTSVPCNVDKLYLLVMLGHMVTPLLILPLSVLLVPNTPMQEPLPEIIAAGVASSGSDGDGGEAANNDDSDDPAANREQGATGGTTPPPASASADKVSGRRGAGYGTVPPSEDGLDGFAVGRRRGTMEEEAEQRLLGRGGAASRRSLDPFAQRASSGVTRRSSANRRSTNRDGDDDATGEESVHRAARASMGFGVM